MSAERDGFTCASAEESLETREATHEWITEFVGDHPYAHGLADDVFDLREALAVAADLLRQDGYDTDPDYRQEWQTITEALGE